MLWPSLLAISRLLLLGKLKLHYTRSLSKPLVLKEWLFQRKLSLVGLVLGVHDSEVHSKHWNYPEDIKKRWQEYTEELYRKDLNDPDNHDGMITHLEPDILESKVKWTLGGINLNKATWRWWNSNWAISNSKRYAVKVLHSICQEIRKTPQWPQDWKMSVFIPKPNVQTTSQLHSSHALTK